MKEIENVDTWHSGFTGNAGYYWLKIDRETMPLRYQYLLIKASWTGYRWRFFDCESEQEIEHPSNTEWKFIYRPKFIAD